MHNGAFTEKNQKKNIIKCKELVKFSNYLVPIGPVLFDKLWMVNFCYFYTFFDIKANEVHCSALHKFSFTGNIKMSHKR